MLAMGKTKRKWRKNRENSGKRGKKLLQSVGQKQKRRESREGGEAALLPSRQLWLQLRGSVSLSTDSQGRRGQGKLT